MAMKLKDHLEFMDSLKDTGAQDATNDRDWIILQAIRSIFTDDQLAAMVDAPERVKIMPCKVGDTVWVISCGEVYECTMDDAMRFSAVHYNLEIMRHFDGKMDKEQRNEY